MNILMVLDHDYPNDDRVEKEINSLIDGGHSIILACFNYKQNRNLFEVKSGLKIYRKTISKFVFKSSVGALKFPFYFNFWRKFIFDICKKEKVDAIHIHDLPLAKIGFLVKKKYNIPFVLDLHENWAEAMRIAAHTNTFIGKVLSSYKQWVTYEKLMVNEADKIITVIEEMKQRIANLGVDHQKIFVVSNTIDMNNFIIPKLEPDNNYISLFYAGGINIHRGLQIVIEGLSLLIKEIPNIRLFIIGRGSYTSTLKKMTSSLGLEGIVHFLGWRSHEEIARNLAQSDIALIPHLRSVQTDCSSPNKIYQYMLARKPILTSNCSSLERMVNETRTGISYIHDNPTDFVEKLKSLINDKQLNELGQNGLKAVQYKFNWRVDEKILLEIYNTAI